MRKDRICKIFSFLLNGWCIVRDRPTSTLLVRYYGTRGLCILPRYTYMAHATVDFRSALFMEFPKGFGSSLLVCSKTPDTTDRSHLIQYVKSQIISLISPTEALPTVGEQVIT